MPIYTIRSIQDGKTLVRKQVTQGSGRDPIILTAQPDVMYLLSDTILNVGPTKIAARRNGKDLLITLDGSHPDIPDVIIEGYFDYPPAPINGMLNSGGYSSYDLGTLSASTAEPPTKAAEQAAEQTVTTDTAVQAKLPQPSWWSDHKWLIGSGLGAVALGAAAASGGGDDAAPAPAADVTALATIKAFADDSNQERPQVKHYTDAGITGVNTANLAAMNSAVEALSAGSVDTKDKLQTVVTAYNKILASTNSTAATATQADVSDFVSIGAEIGLSKSSASHLSLLNSAIGNLTQSQIDSVAEINAVAVVVDKIMGTATGQTLPLTVQDFATMGIATLGSGAVTEANLASVSSAIARAGGQTAVDTFAELNTLVTAITTIYNYASDGSQATPITSHYTTLGVTGVTDSNLSAINSAVNALSEQQVGSRAQLQTVVDAYAFILAEANGATTDATPTSNPTVQQFATIGANIGQSATQVNNLSLLNDVIGNLAVQQVNTVDKINALAAVADKIMSQAAGLDSNLTVADFALLGIATSGTGAVTAANLTAVNQAIASAGGAIKVDTFAELSGVVAAQAAIFNYASDNTQTAPTLANYTALGINGVNTNNLTSINSAIDASAGLSVDTTVEVQAIVDAYNFILAEANGTAIDVTPQTNPTAQQYTLIGANIGSAADQASNLKLLNDALGGQVVAAVSTVAQINDLAAASNAVMTNARGADVVTAAQLVSLGITGVTVNNLSAVQNAIARTADNGTQVDNLSSLQGVVTSAATAASGSQAIIQNYASNGNNPAPTLTDYVNIGVSGVSTTNLSAVNSAIDALVSSQVANPYQVQAVIDQLADSVDISALMAPQVFAITGDTDTALTTQLSTQDENLSAFRLDNLPKIDQTAQATDGLDTIESIDWDALGFGTSTTEPHNPQQVDSPVLPLMVEMPSASESLFVHAHDGMIL